MLRSTGVCLKLWSVSLRTIPMAVTFSLAQQELMRVMLSNFKQHHILILQEKLYRTLANMWPESGCLSTNIQLSAYKTVRSNTFFRLDTVSEQILRILHFCTSKNVYNPKKTMNCQCRIIPQNRKYSSDSLQSSKLVDICMHDAEKRVEFIFDGIVLPYNETLLNH